MKIIFYGIPPAVILAKGVSMSGKQKNQEQKRRKGQESILKMQISKKLAKGKIIREIAQELEMEESEIQRLMEE